MITGGFVSTIYGLGLIAPRFRRLDIEDARWLDDSYGFYGIAFGRFGIFLMKRNKNGSKNS